MKKFRYLTVVFLILFCFVCAPVLAADPEGNFSYYDVSEVSYGSFVLPEVYNNHVFYGKVIDENKTALMTLDAEAFTHTCFESSTNLMVYSSESLAPGPYTFSLVVEECSTGEIDRYDIPIEYENRRPTTTLTEIPAGEGQYRIFFENLLIDETISLEVSMLNEEQEMVATTYLDFSSENLVGSMLTRKPSGVPGHSFVEMVTLFQTGPIVAGEYQLYFNLGGKLVAYQDTCKVRAVDMPIVYSVNSAFSQDFIYGENHLHPMVAGASGFDVIITGFQIDPQRISATLYDTEGDRVAKSVSYLYHDALTLGYGAINGYQKESGIQAIVLHMDVFDSAILTEDADYRISLSYSGSRLYGKKENYCRPESGLFVTAAEPYDVSSLELSIVNANAEATYEVYLQDDAYGELYCGSFTIPDDGFLRFDVGTSLTNGQGALVGSDGGYVQFFYKNELIGLFVPQEVRVNPVVLHPTTTEYVAHFEMRNFSLSEGTSVDVQLLKFAEKINGAYMVLEEPFPVARSNDIKSVVRSKQDGYYNTDILIELKVTDALAENALYSYLINIDGHEIYLIDQGEAYIVQVVNNTVYEAEIIDRTILGGIPVMQKELYFLCNGVVVRDLSALSFVLVDELGNVVAVTSKNSLTPLSAEAEKQFCGRLDVVSELEAGAEYRLLAKYGNDVLYTSETYFGDDGLFGTVLAREDLSVSAGERKVAIFSQLINYSVNEVCFEIIDLLNPFDQPEILSVRTSYNFDAYYQWKHELILDRALHEGVYKVVLSCDGVNIADTMVCVTAKTIIKEIEAVFDENTVEGYRIFLDNYQVNTSYGLLFGRISLFSDALIIGEKVPTEDGIIYLRKEELNALAVGEYDVFLTQSGVPVSGFAFYYSPFSTPLNVIEGNILDEELDAGENILTISFSQPLNINTISTETVFLLDPDGISVPITVSTSPNRYELIVYPQNGLHAEVQYTLVLTTAIRGVFHGQMKQNILFDFVVSDGGQIKMDFFVPADQSTEIQTNEAFTLSFLEGSFEEDALLGVWSEDVAVDLEGLVGLEQASSVVVITDYQEDIAFSRPALLTFNNYTLTDDKSFVILRFDPKAGRFQQVEKATYNEGAVHAVVAGCGRYVLCHADGIPFKDVEGTWAEKYVKPLWHQKIVSGYDTSTYGTNQWITRSEFIKMLINALDVTLIDPQGYNLSLFRDYGQIEEWALPYWATAYQLNVIKGTSAITLSPNDYITRSEIVVILSRAKMLPSTDTELPFTDSDDIPVWTKLYYGTVFDLGILTGYPDGSARPNGFATRAETAKIIYELLHLE